MKKLFSKVFGTANARKIKEMAPMVAQINSLESGFKALSDEALLAKTTEFKDRYAKGAKLDDLLPEAFAAVREAAQRSLGMRHYDVQLMGGMVLHQGVIAEMKTGEGKTLMATLPLYLNALTGKGCHLVTVNDYLAKRDAEWMAPVFKKLGMSVGYIIHDLSDRDRQQAYAADITYGTNNEFGFDYLRDNMKVTAESLVQRDLHYAIVDEVDSILIDEARTPLIISGAVDQTTDKYVAINRIIPFLKRDIHYTVDEKSRSAMLTDEGVEEVQKRLRIDNLYDPRYISFLHHVDQALKAHAIFKKDIDYVVKDGEVIIVDEFTGRLAAGRRFSDGLHQALEAKEGVTVANENQTLASITYQNYFRMYDKLAGMTGTADTEAEEFASIYKLEVTVIPTNRPMVRADQPDVVYKTEKAKFRAIVADIKERNKKGQPVLVGTTSIEKSERLSEFLKREGIQHTVLNAKQHEREASIVEKAGEQGAVTISTSMAGRGTDIKLGEGVKERGGLYILGCERHESRRIDNQLRGRAGRQGDPGESRFYLSLEDQLLRIFAGDRLLKMMDLLNMDEDEPIESRLVSKSIEDAQTRVEARNFDYRKHLLKYDDVMNHQRKIVYGWRRKLLHKEDVADEIEDLAEEVLGAMAENFLPHKNRHDQWEWESFEEELKRIFNHDFDLAQVRQAMDSGSSDIRSDAELFQYLFEKWQALYKARKEELGEQVLKLLERRLLLFTLDDRWKEHLLDMDHLREGINLRGYAQKDPVLDYQQEGYRLFQTMFFRVKQEFLEKLHRVQVNVPTEQEAKNIAEVRRDRIEQEMQQEERARQERAKQFQFGGPRKQSQEATKPETVKRDLPKVGRNDPCPCGSGKKYKKCHGTASAAAR